MDDKKKESLTITRNQYVWSSQNCRLSLKTNLASSTHWLNDLLVITSKKIRKTTILKSSTSSKHAQVYFDHVPDKRNLPSLVEIMWRRSSLKGFLKYLVPVWTVWVMSNYSYCSVSALVFHTRTSLLFSMHIGLTTQFSITTTIFGFNILG